MSEAVNKVASISRPDEVLRPLEMRRVGEDLRIVWNDQSLSSLPWSEIRKTCRCAVCLEMKTPLQENQSYYARAIRPRTMSVVGNYAVEIAWEDGHSSIVPFDRLRSA